jgi:hypothetical protein
MPSCPFCTRDNPAEAIVCGACGRDIAVPPQLSAERDDLIRKRDHVRDELSRTRAELERLMRKPARRSP